MADSYGVLTTRNQGIISAKNQKILHRATVAIAGCGADGGAPAVSLARLGVRHFRLADPDCFDTTNINRQEGAFHSTLGQNKAVAIAKIIQDIDVSSETIVYSEGVTEKNIDDFVKGSDIILEEIDYRQAFSTLIIHRAARKYNIPVVTGVSVGWNSFVFYFDPKGMTYEKFVGMPANIGRNKRLLKIDQTAFVPELPSYLSRKLIKDVLLEKIEIPVIDAAVRLASALTSSFCYFLLTGVRDVKPVPYYYSVGDLFTKSEQRSPNH